MDSNRISPTIKRANFRENLNPEDLATQSVRLKEEQLRREEGRLKEIEVHCQFYFL
jgi:cell division control protein 11